MTFKIILQTKKKKLKTLNHSRPCYWSLTPVLTILREIFGAILTLPKVNIRMIFFSMHFDE